MGVGSAIPLRPLKPAEIEADRRRLRRLSTLLGASVLLFLIAAAVAASPHGAASLETLWRQVLLYAGAALLGGGLGWAELASRYRDSPAQLTRMRSAYIYVGFNAVFSALALTLLQLGQGLGSSTNEHLQQMALAGFGGALLLRSSVARTKISESEVAVGPAFLVDMMLSVTDRAIDRASAAERISVTQRVMANVSPDFAVKPFAAVCMAGMQNLSAEEKERIDQRLAALSVKGISPDVRSLIAGLILSEYVGLEVLEQTAASLQRQIARARRRYRKTMSADDGASEVAAYLDSEVDEAAEPEPAAPADAADAADAAAPAETAAALTADAADAAVEDGADAEPEQAGAVIDPAEPTPAAASAPAASSAPAESSSPSKASPDKAPIRNRKLRQPLGGRRR
ncbi:MAG: hypothetical protein AAF192_07845 [Pseudomonadota bacterium]